MNYHCIAWILSVFPGEHRFSWAVMPHEGHFLESDVPVAGQLYNSPLRGKSLLLFG